MIMNRKNMVAVLALGAGSAAAFSPSPLAVGILPAHVDVFCVAPSLHAAWFSSFRVKTVLHVYKPLPFLSQGTFNSLGRRISFAASNMVHYPCPFPHAQKRMPQRVRVVHSEFWPWPRRRARVSVLTCVFVLACSC
jgi:hypothetical protein